MVIRAIYTIKESSQHFYKCNYTIQNYNQTPKLFCKGGQGENIREIFYEKINQCIF